MNVRKEQKLLWTKSDSVNLWWWRGVCVRVPSRTPWTVALQAPLSMEFSRQEYWSGLPFPTPGGLPDLAVQFASLVSPTLAGRFFTTVPLGKPQLICTTTLLK